MLRIYGNKRSHWEWVKHGLLLSCLRFFSSASDIMWLDFGGNGEQARFLIVQLSPDSRTSFWHNFHSDISLTHIKWSSATTVMHAFFLFVFLSLPFFFLLWLIITKLSPYYCPVPRNNPLQRWQLWYIKALVASCLWMSVATVQPHSSTGSLCSTRSVFGILQLLFISVHFSSIVFSPLF